MTVSGLDAEYVVAPAQVLHEGVTANDHLGGLVRPVHRPQTNQRPPDPAFGEGFLEISIGQPEPQMPAHRQKNHFGWDPEASGRRQICSGRGQLQ